MRIRKLLDKNRAFKYFSGMNLPTLKVIPKQVLPPQIPVIPKQVLPPKIPVIPKQGLPHKITLPDVGGRPAKTADVLEKIHSALDTADSVLSNGVFGTYVVAKSAKNNRVGRLAGRVNRGAGRLVAPLTAARGVTDYARLASDDKYRDATMEQGSSGSITPAQAALIATDLGNLPSLVMAGVGAYGGVLEARADAKEAQLALAQQQAMAKRRAREKEKEKKEKDVEELAKYLKSLRAHQNNAKPISERDR